MEPLKRSKPRRKKSKLKKILLLVLLIILAIGGYYVYSIFNFVGKIQGDPNNNDMSERQIEKIKWEGKERVNILLLGGDSRGVNSKELPRSDSMLVVSLDPVTKNASLLSILRDTYVEIPDHRSQRINTAVTMGGPDLAKETVSQLLGIPIHYYVYTDFEGFISLIDAMGGIEFYVEKDMDYVDNADGNRYDIHLKEGLQELDGNTALQYVRFRHDALSDYSRSERQRKFLSALADQLQSSSSLMKLPSILRSMQDYIQTDLGFIDMIKLGRLGLESDTSNIVSEQVPPSHLLREENIGGASVITVDKVALQQFIQEKFSEQPASDAEGTEGSDGTAGSGDNSGS